MKKSYVYILYDNQKRFNVKSEESPYNDQDKRLVYYEVYDDLLQADSRKRTIESWPKRKIEFLINLVNPQWDDWKNQVITN